jgi:RNA polymerase-binding transcription factor DksA
LAKKVKKKTSKKVSKKTVKKKASVRTKKKVAKKAAKKKTVKAKVKKTSKKNIARTAKKTSRKITRRRRKSILTAKELAHFRELLIEKLKEIIGSVTHIEDGALKTSRLDSTGDLSSMPIHMADIGSDNYEQEFALGLMDSERKIVQEIYEALERIKHKTYGICEGTGEPIPKMRLEGIPWTRYCVKYAEMVENGLVHQDSYEYDYDQDQFDEDLEDLEDVDDRDMDNYFLGIEDEQDDEEE